MRAAVYEGRGGLDVIHVRERPQPVPGSGEVLVRVAYAGLNRADVLERQGRYGAGGDDPVVPGIEYSGTVVSLGGAVRGRSVGQRVCGIVNDGAHAEFLCVAADATIPVPPHLSLEDAASIPEAFLTAYDALFTRGAYAFGERVLVHAVGSSVGLAATALAARAGAFVIGTSRTPEKLERARDHGIDAGILLDDGFAERVRSIAGGVDIVLDFIGPHIFDRNVEALASGGRIVQIGTLAGAQGAMNAGLFMAKRATLVGTVLRSRPLDEKVALARTFANRLMSSFERGDLRATIDRIVPLERIADAHAAMESNETFGKIVLAVGSESDR